MKVKFITSLCGLDTNYQAKDEVEIKDDEAIRLIKNNIAIPVGKTNEKKYKDALEKEAQEQEDLVKKQKEAEAILYGDELASEREKLQKRIDEINAILADKKEK